MKVKGRIAKVNPKTTTPRLEYYPEIDTFVLRLDDTENLDFWMEIEFTNAEIAEVIKAGYAS